MVTSTAVLMGALLALMIAGMQPAVAGAQQSSLLRLQLGDVEQTGAGYIVPVILDNESHTVGAVQFVVGHGATSAPLDCQIPATAGLAGSCRVSADSTRFSVFTMQGLAPGSSVIGLLEVGSSVDVPVEARLVTIVDPTGSRLEASDGSPNASQSESVAPPQPAAPEPSVAHSSHSRGDDGVSAAPAIAGDTEQLATTAASPAIGSGVPLVPAQPLVDQPVVDQPVAEAPVAVEAPPVIEEPVVEPREVEAPPLVVEKPVVEEQVVEEPVAEVPVAAAPVVEAVDVAVPPVQASISFVGPDEGAMVSPPWGLRSEAVLPPTAMLSPLSKTVGRAFGPSPDAQAAATAVLSGALLGGGVLVANRRAVPLQD